MVCLQRCPPTRTPHGVDTTHTHKCRVKRGGPLHRVPTLPTLGDIQAPCMLTLARGESAFVRSRLLDNDTPTSLSQQAPQTRLRERKA